MFKKIIQIDKETCSGCGLCVSACHEGAIGLVDGKAELLREDTCDGLGACLPVCPTGAISFEEREAPACCGAAAMQSTVSPRQWPVQIRLVPVNAKTFENAALLIAADCAAYTCSDFHAMFMRDAVTLIGCPKLDAVDYSEKLTAILRENRIQSVTVVRMEVPCCGGLEHAVTTALANCGKTIPLRTVTLALDGRILNR